MNGNFGLILSHFRDIEVSTKKSNGCPITLTAADIDASAHYINDCGVARCPYETAWLFVSGWYIRRYHRPIQFPPRVTSVLSRLELLAVLSLAGVASITVHRHCTIERFCRWGTVEWTPAPAVGEIDKLSSRDKPSDNCPIRWTGLFRDLRGQLETTRTIDECRRQRDDKPQSSLGLRRSKIQ